MSITLEQIFTWAGILIAGLGSWYAYQYKVQRLEEKDLEQARQIDALWKWKDSHEKESVFWRQDFNKDISKLEGQNLVVNEQFRQIMSILQEIKGRISHLEEEK